MGYIYPDVSHVYTNCGVIMKKFVPVDNRGMSIRYVYV